MKKLIMIVVVICLGSGLAHAKIYQYGWEDEGTVLGFSGVNRFGGEPVIYASVAHPRSPVHSGTGSLRLEDNMLDGTPSAFLVAVYGLRPGDTVRAGFMRYDTNVSRDAGCMIRGHWCNELPDRLFDDNGFAGGQDDLGSGTGWTIANYDFVVPQLSRISGLVIEVCTYSKPGDVVYIDDLVVEIPDGASIILPHTRWVGTEDTSFGSVKVLFR